MSKEIERHERYKLYAQNSYKLKIKLPQDIFPYGFQQNSKTGFFGYALVEKDRVVVIFRGTNNLISPDTKNDFFMVLNKIPEQLTDALNFYDDVKSKFPNKKIDVTGHSLGGSLAQYTHVLTKGINETVTFNPYGTYNTLKEYLKNNQPQSSIDKIENYCASGDIISNKLSQKSQIGTCYEIKVNENSSKDILSKFIHLNSRKLFFYGLDNFINTSKKIKNAHQVENMKPLSERKKIQKNKAQKTISENSSSNCIGSYTVQGYTRSDGTKVREYIRTCGKHNKMSMEERAKGQAKYKGKRFQDIPLDELEEAIGYFV